MFVTSVCIQDKDTVHHDILDLWKVPNFSLTVVFKFPQGLENSQHAADWTQLLQPPGSTRHPSAQVC